MPFNSYWYEDHIFLKPAQHASGQDIVETIRALFKDQRYDPSLHQVWDFSQTEELTIQSADLKAINALSEECCLVTSMAYLAMVAPNPAVYCRIQALVSFTKTGKCNSKVFTDLDKALHWMDIDPQKSN